MAMRDEAIQVTEADRAAKRAPAPRDHALPGDFSEWYEEHRSTVYRYVRYRVATREVAEDVTSEVFMKALRSFKRYDPSRAAGIPSVASRGLNRAPGSSGSPGTRSRTTSEP